MPSKQPEPEEHENESVMQEAERLVNGNREADYGHPRDNFALIGRLFQEYLIARGIIDGEADVEIDGADAAQMMLLLKVARFATGGRKRDTVVDQAGYAGVTARVIGLDP